jgi:hypothetical protein
MFAIIESGKIKPISYEKAMQEDMMTFWTNRAPVIFTEAQVKEVFSENNSDIEVWG